MHLPDLKELCMRLIPEIRKTGNWIVRRAGSAELQIHHKGLNNFVTDIDTGAEQRLVKQLGDLLPEAGFLTEEKTVSQQQKDGLYWIIDPIDGTTNFIHGLPCFAISIALHFNERPLIGMVYEISRDECFYCWEKGPAFLNGKPITTSKCPSLEDALVATGFPYENFDWMPAYIKAISSVMCRSQGIRRWGSASVDLAYVACGRFDGFFEYNLNSWDVAAGVMLVRAAGGTVTTFDPSSTEISDPVFDRQIVAAANAAVGIAISSLVGEHMC